MGLTTYLTLIYTVLFIIDIYVFIKAKKRKKYLAFIIITVDNDNKNICFRLLMD